MYFKKLTAALLLLMLISAAAGEPEIIPPALENKNSFAVVIDRTTFSRTENAVMAYKEAVEADGLSVYILINKWKNPEEVRSELKKLYSHSPRLEGAVFIGDIPIPMISKAQHLTSALRSNEQRYPLHASSVPSDRFYDDFDLEFRFTGRDSANPLLYYYELTPGSLQKISREIYSARIKYSGKPVNRFKGISDYLLKAAREKKKNNIINDALIFTGYGYYSGSLTAWADKRIPLMEQFPQLFLPGGRVKNIHHSMDINIKQSLLGSVQQPGLDIALFHAHGSTGAQMVINYPVANDARQNADALKLFLRTRLRAAGKDSMSVIEVRARLKKEYNVPDDWFNGAFDKKIIEADSVNRLNQNIYIEDIRGITARAKFIMLDQCYSGPFQADEYLGGEFIFGNGDVIAAEVNSVNVLQDKWNDEFLGMLNYGSSLGMWHLNRNLLESHLLGDPTFRFSPAGNNHEPLSFSSRDEVYWEEILGSSNPVFRDLAVSRLYSMRGKKFEKQLTELYKKDPSIQVRMHSLKYLSELNSNSLREILRYSVNDPYEYIRRISAVLIGETGDKSLLPYLADQLFTEESSRVLFNARHSLAFFNSHAAYAACIAASEKNQGNNKPLVAAYTELIEKSEKWLKDYLLKNIRNDSLPEAERIEDIRSFRNNRMHEGVTVLLEILTDRQENDAVRTAAAEALGWFCLSFQKDKILKQFNSLLEESSKGILADEIIKSRNRLEQGANDPVLL